MQQRGITLIDIGHVVKGTGMVIDSSRARMNWRYIVEGQTADRKLLRVVVEIEDDLIIITVLYPSRR